MSEAVLSEPFLARAAGWQAMKEARSLLAAGKVFHSDWTPPMLKGEVQGGAVRYRAGLRIQSATNIDNLCTCRQSREWGTLCAHSVAVGLHHLNHGKGEAPVAAVETGGNKPAEGEASLNPDRPRRWRAAGGEENDEPLWVHVILPPNPAEAVARGKVMLVLEGEWDGKRRPLNSLPADRLFAVQPVDESLLDEIERLAGGATPGMVMLSGGDFARVLERLIDHPRVTAGKSKPITVSSQSALCRVRARLQSSGEIELRLEPGLEGALVNGETAIWTLAGRTFQRLGLPVCLHPLVEGPMRLERTEVPDFLIRDWPRLRQECELDADITPEDFVLEPRAPRFQMELEGGLAQLRAKLSALYGERTFPLGGRAASEAHWIPAADSPITYSTRDLAAEREVLTRLIRAGFSEPDGEGRLHLKGQDSVLRFFAMEFPRCQREWSVTLEERLERSTRDKVERIEPEFRVTGSGVQWFDLEIGYATGGGERFSAADIQRLVRSGQGHTRLRNGKFAVLDTGAVEELQEVLVDAAPRQEGGSYRFGHAQAGFIDQTVSDQRWRIEAPDVWRERVRSQTGGGSGEPPPLGDLENVLRPYQRQGVAWMDLLHRNGFGGVLADEMGLGKTLQALAWLEVCRVRARGRPGGNSLPSLVVCPSSLVFNWVAEAGRFTPGLKVLDLTGPRRRERFAGLEDCDLVITSYALLRRDAEFYRGKEFEAIVLDEAQHIKNRETQNARAVKAVRGRQRFVLTGTPLENSVLDLWSILDFLMPGYLGSAKDFRERYETPMTRDRDATVQARLVRRVRPFILRRLKRDVAAELPDKLEQVLFCDLTADQAAVYREVLEASRREVLNAEGEGGTARSRMVVLNALLRLRQVCCDLRLLDIKGVDAANASGKGDLFGELLDEVIDGGHRVLVFSQFVTMLKLLREKLDAGGVRYCYLDGSTTERGRVVERFQRDLRIPVFLISLKAGGVGLNLTGADTVVHFDPWWNPAVEDQATDRAHRIGQTRVVTSYKLIARGTVEEKILKLQERKRELFKGLLDGEEAFTSALSWDEMRELLE